MHVTRTAARFLQAIKRSEKKSALAQSGKRVTGARGSLLIEISQWTPISADAPALSFFLVRAAGVLLTRCRMAINHGNWLAVYGRRREGIGFTRDCITGWGVSQLPGVAFYNVTTDISPLPLPPLLSPQYVPRVYPRPQQARAAHARIKTAVSATINAAILTECLHGFSIRETDNCRRPIIMTRCIRS